MPFRLPKLTRALFLLALSTLLIPSLAEARFQLGTFLSGTFHPLASTSKGSDSSAAEPSDGTTSASGKFQLAPFKDDLFGYSKILATFDEGTFQVVEYIKKRDLYARDKVPMQEVFGNYVSYRPNRYQTDQAFQANGRTVRYISVGRANRSTRLVVLYVHGQGGDRFQGVNDVMFGGNFNRLKNLMVRNHGLYISADFTDYTQRGLEDIKAILARVRQKIPNAPVMVACGSMGSIMCWDLVKSPETAHQLGGILLLGATHDPSFEQSPVFRDAEDNVPIFIGHGSDDPVYDWQAEARFFEHLRRLRPHYPLHYTLFDTGAHGTPLRMTDWRRVLNWMLSLR